MERFIAQIEDPTQAEIFKNSIQQLGTLTASKRCLSDPRFMRVCFSRATQHAIDLGRLSGSVLTFTHT